MPRCHLARPEDRKTEELDHIYKIANVLPEFLEERGFTVEPTGGIGASSSPLLSDSVRPYYRDYIASATPNGYRSLHITFYDNSARCYMEVQQLELKDLDVNMFAAADNSLINDGCGLYRGRQILPYEHLSRFQSD